MNGRIHRSMMHPCEPGTELKISSEVLASPVQDLLDDLHARLSMLTEGDLASYIPELSKADPNWFGIALATVNRNDEDNEDNANNVNNTNGIHIYESGDSRIPFTIQSVSKPFVYALALADRGLKEVLSRVGVEPTGEAFNAIRLEGQHGRPYNPMVNTGAIVTTSLVSGIGTEERFQRILEGLSAFAGRPLAVDDKVFASERATGNRNRALAYLMQGAGSLEYPVEDALEVYFRQCSILVTARDLAIMAATLADGGVNPVTKQAVVDPETAKYTLSVMATCGTYDYAGEWMFRAGLPAKTGVSGGLAASSPSQLGIGIFSPLLDCRGNSVRALAAGQELSSRFGLHLMRLTGKFNPVLRQAGRGHVQHSSCRRPPAEQQILERRGSAIGIHQLQGDLAFTEAESIVRSISNHLGDMSWLILDLRQVGRVEAIAIDLLDALVVKLAAAGIITVTVDREQREEPLLPSVADYYHTPDEALERCEDALLVREGAIQDDVVLTRNDLPVGKISSESLGIFHSHMEEREFSPGHVLISRDQNNNALCFLFSGSLARVKFTGNPPRAVKDASIAPDAVLGSLTQVKEGNNHRVVVESHAVCKVLTMDSLNRLAQEHPPIVAALRWAITQALATRLQKTDSERQKPINGYASNGYASEAVLV